MCQVSLDQYNPSKLESGLVASYIGVITRELDGGISFSPSSQALYVHDKIEEIIQLHARTYGVSLSEYRKSLDYPDVLMKVRVGKEYIAEHLLIFKQADELKKSFLELYLSDEPNAYIDYGNPSNISVNVLGDLYIGRDFLNVLNGDELKLAFLHEASHVIPVSSEGNLYVKEFIMSSIRKKLKSPKYLLDNIAALHGKGIQGSTVHPLIHSTAGSVIQNETSIDAFVLSIIAHDGQCMQYKNMLNRLIDHEPQEDRLAFLDVACRLSKNELYESSMRINKLLHQDERFYDPVEPFRTLHSFELGVAFNKSLIKENYLGIKMVLDELFGN